MCKGFYRREVYFEVFSLVVKITSIGLVLGIMVIENLHLEQLDVKIVFPYNDLEEDIYVHQ